MQIPKSKPVYYVVLENLGSGGHILKANLLKKLITSQETIEDKSVSAFNSTQFEEFVLPGHIEDDLQPLAVQTAREDRGFRGTFKLATPSTPDNVVQAINSS